ncbi:1-acyl-sn-glycerol-3-phosphate acyltransferase [Flammeovirga sp. OC4]|uniref:1-acyl-sn-glycerol-3-phosphate acyltransferase n=1 Tax=Flammeovirga sp. OC4 TaxID=1382345 RepID=UPI0005C74576|nr:1-acyl-sn-glycerol-3-phosphate acyltransferase [Flammeovirga sp. OC4]
MPLTTTLLELPFADRLNESELEILSENAELVTFEDDEIITLQFASAEQFYILYSGKVEYHLNVGDQRGGLTVGENNEKGTPIGWSGFREPYRFATTAKAKGKTQVVVWDNQLLRDLFDSNPQIGMHFLSSTLLYSTHLLRDARNVWIQGSIPMTVDSLEGNTTYTSFQDKGPVESNLEFFRQSNFFNPFSDWHLMKLANISDTKYYKQGEKLLSKGEASNKFMVLKSGKVALNYVKDNGEIYTSDILQERGQVILWSAASFDAIPNFMELVVLEPIEVLEIQRIDLLVLYGEFPNLGMVFMYRLLWLLGSALKAVRAQVITQTYDRELLTIQTMIDQAGAQLNVTSDIHKIPSLLSEKLTQGIAFDLLDQLSKTGVGQERSLANLFVKVTAPLRKEYLFMEGLKKMTNHVIKAPKTIPASQLRNECSELFEKAIAYLDIKIEGLENIPKESGNIFIYNHLLNHPYYTLPNNFQITLDSHFISMLLFKFYKDSGLRVVRIGKGPEYGHQDYYNKLGHIGVRTADSDPSKMSDEEKRRNRNLFFDEASSKLKEGINLILSPEGTSRETHQSPVDFKPGAFMIANHSGIDPLIVPIALSFFDKRMSKAKLGVVIKPAFRLSEVIDTTKPFKEELRGFLKSYSKKYRSYVEEAIQLVEN